MPLPSLKLRLSKVSISRVGGALAMLGLVIGCSSSKLEVSPTTLRQGMTSKQLVSAYGEPLRKVRRADAGEDWFYYFGSQTRELKPINESVQTPTERSVSTGTSNSVTTTMTELPIHLSLSGTVIGEIPSGRVITR